MSETISVTDLQPVQPAQGFYALDEAGFHGVIAKMVDPIREAEKRAADPDTLPQPISASQPERLLVPFEDSGLEITFTPTLRTGNSGNGGIFGQTDIDKEDGSAYYLHIQLVDGELIFSFH